MEKHVKIISWLYVVEGLLTMMLLFGGSSLLIGLGFMTEDRGAAGILAILVGIIVWIGVIFTIPQFIGAWGMLKRKNWARILMIIISILNLLEPPFGTALGIYALVILFREDAKPFFNG